jgi:hypothetical protein
MPAQDRPPADGVTHDSIQATSVSLGQPEPNTGGAVNGNTGVCTGPGLDREAGNVEEDSDMAPGSPQVGFKSEPGAEKSTDGIALAPANESSSSLVSPPESAHTDVEKTPPAQSTTKSMTPSVNPGYQPPQTDPAKQGPRFTPDSGPARRASTSPLGEGSVGAGSSPVFGQGGISAPKRMKSRKSSEIDADPESLKLIRELQVQDMGLRRRAKV